MLTIYTWRILTLNRRQQVVSHDDASSPDLPRSSEPHTRKNPPSSHLEIQGKTLPPPIWKYLAKAPRDGEIGKFLEKAPKDRNIWKYLAKAPKDGIIGKFLDGIFGKFLAKAPRDKRLLRYLFFLSIFCSPENCP